jgi:hypothetical protein
MRNPSLKYLLAAFCAMCLLWAGMLLAAPAVQNSTRVLSLDDVLALVKAKTSEEVVLNFVNGQEGRYALTAKDIVALKGAGASDKVIAAMQNKSAPGSSSAQPALGTAAAGERGIGRGQPGQAQQIAGGACQVSISAPLQGSRVGAEGRVRGTAKIPAGTHVWVLSHMKDLAAEWWPQGGREALLEPDGGWVIIAGYGQPQDAGEAFEVAAVVVSDGTHSLLKKWFDDALRRNSYPPIPFPESAPGCVPVKVTVIKSQ